MEKTNIGKNRTGIEASPMDSKKMVEAARNAPMEYLGKGEDPTRIRRNEILNSDQVGTVPIPMSFKGLSETAIQRLKGKRAETLIDKLGERLAFERAGTRLYDLLLNKCESKSDSLGSISIDRIREFRSDEAKHFALIHNTLLDIGADPTAETPCADVVGVLSSGALKVIADPRTTLAQTLHAILTLELDDNASWELLIRLAQEVGADELIGPFQVALQEEQEHLKYVQSWLEDLTLAELKVA